jgi:hypothetical protein
MPYLVTIYLVKDAQAAQCARPRMMGISRFDGAWQKSKPLRRRRRGLGTYHRSTSNRSHRDVHARRRLQTSRRGCCARRRGRLRHPSQPTATAARVNSAPRPRGPRSGRSEHSEQGRRLPCSIRPRLPYIRGCPTAASPSPIAGRRAGVLWPLPCRRPGPE